MRPGSLSQRIGSRDRHLQSGSVDRSTQPLELANTRHGVVGNDLLGAASDTVKPTIRTEGLPVAALAVCNEQRGFPASAKLVGLAVGNVVEEDLALGVYGRSFGRFVALGNQFPILARSEQSLELR